MSRRLIAWLSCIPLMLGGTEVAHWLAFRIVYPDSWARSQALGSSGHGYFGWLPAVGGVSAALLVSALFLHARDASKGGARGGGSAHLSRFAALPPLTFALQEHLERLIHNGTAFGVVFEPTFMLGLVLQLPFAVAAYLLSRLLLRVAERVGRRLAPRSRARRRFAIPSGAFLCWLGLAPPRMAALASGHAERGPPV